MDNQNQSQKKPAENLPAKNSLQLIKSGLFADNAITMFKDSLPQALGKAAQEVATRFAKNVYTYICQNPDLQDCTLPSIIRASCLSASLNLDIDPRGLAYLVPYMNNKVKPARREAQFQIGYLGLIELAYRSGKVLDISAHCIYESEKNFVKITRTDGRYKVEHPFSYTPPTGKMIATYATAEVEGFGSRTIVLRIDEVEAARIKSKAPNSPAWANFYEAMAKKTAIRRLAKFLPKSILEDFARGAAIDEKENFVEAKETVQKQIEGSMGSEPIDTTFEPGTTPAPKVKKEPKVKPPKTKDESKHKFVCICKKGRLGFDKPKKGPHGEVMCPYCLSIADVRATSDASQEEIGEPDTTNDTNSGLQDLMKDE